MAWFLVNLGIGWLVATMAPAYLAGQMSLSLTDFVARLFIVFFWQYTEYLFVPKMLASRDEGSI